MEIFTVSLFGHREIHDLRQLEGRLVPILTELIQSKPYVSFLVGRNGEFDEYVASIIKRLRKECGRDNCDITLVLPYMVSDIEYYEKYYDSIIIPEELYNAHYKLAITLKNRWVIEHSELIIVYVERKGGAYSAMKYAEKMHKNVINLYENISL